jgi:hypothetical protein
VADRIRYATDVLLLCNRENSAAGYRITLYSKPAY